MFMLAGWTTQKELYQRLVQRTTRDVMFGYSATIFVYGQTASGYASLVSAVDFTLFILLV